MSYDPREGSSPYLGMDYDDEPLGEEARTEDARANAQVKQRTTVAPSPQKASRDVPPTMLRNPQAPQRGVAPRPQNAPRRPAAVPAPAPRPAQVEQRQAPRAVPSPEQQAYVPAPSPVPKAIGQRFEGPLTSLKATLVLLLAWILRFGAWVLALFVVVSAVLTGSMRAQLINMLDIAPLLVPPSLLGLFVRDTPFGGILRGDMIIASIILFFADWFCVRFSTSLRRRRERSL